MFLLKKKRKSTVEIQLFISSKLRMKIQLMIKSRSRWRVKKILTQKFTLKALSLIAYEI